MVITAELQLTKEDWPWEGQNKDSWASEPPPPTGGGEKKIGAGLV